MTEIETNAKCYQGHPLWLVAEGYAICCSVGGSYWYAWKLHGVPVTDGWGKAAIRAAAGGEQLAYVTGPLWVSKERALALIAADIEAARALPYDEERERARLVAL